jgi:hypothetical protein
LAGTVANVNEPRKERFITSVPVSFRRR